MAWQHRIGTRPSSREYVVTVCTGSYRYILICASIHQLSHKYSKKFLDSILPLQRLQIIRGEVSSQTYQMYICLLKGHSHEKVLRLNKLINNHLFSPHKYLFKSLICSKLRTANPSVIFKIARRITKLHKSVEKIRHQHRSARSIYISRHANIGNTHN
jgi:hypothetical protein